MKSLIKLCSAMLGLLVVTTAHAACIPSGTDAAINAALSPSPHAAMLCQGATFTLSHQIVMHTGYSLYTQGFPTAPSSMATLTWAAHTAIPTGQVDPPPGTGAVATYALIDAYGSNISIKSIIVDGNLANNTYYGHSPLLRFLPESGAESGNTVDSVTLQHTLGFVALDAADYSGCTSLNVTNSRFLSNGVHLPQTINGATVKQAWANGMTIQCSNSMIAGNQVTDATDGGIDFLGGSSTTIQNNTITNSGQSAYGGILVDPVQAGSGTSVAFTGSKIQNNLIQTSNGQHMHAAISVGTQYSCTLNQSHAWNGNCAVATGAQVINNTGTGTFGFGIYLGGATGATVTGDNLTMTPLAGMQCGWQYYVENVSYTTPATPATTGTFQSGYTTQALEWPCIVVPSEQSF